MHSHIRHRFVGQNQCNEFKWKLMQLARHYMPMHSCQQVGQDVLLQLTFSSKFPGLMKVEELWRSMHHRGKAVLSQLSTDIKSSSCYCCYLRIQEQRNVQNDSQTVTAPGHGLGSFHRQIEQLQPLSIPAPFQSTPPFLLSLFQLNLLQEAIRAGIRKAKKLHHSDMMEKRRRTECQLYIDVFKNKHSPMSPTASFTQRCREAQELLLEDRGCYEQKGVDGLFHF